MMKLYRCSGGWLLKAILLSGIFGFVIALSASQLSAQESVTLYLPFSPEVGGVRVNQTGLLYQEEYEAAGHPTVTGNCNANSYCNGPDGEYHDYNSLFNFSRGAIDFALRHNTMVFAAASGTVRDDTGMDKCQVAIEHSDGTVAYYMHLSAIHVEPGQQIEQGEHIAHVGSGCGATQPVLHFALWRGSKEIKAYFADASVQAHGGIVRPSRTNYVEYRYTADAKENQHNLLVNPSFESGSQPPWTWSGSCNSAVYSHSDTVLHGEHYLATNRKDNPDCTSFYQDFWQTPSVDDTYRFAIWLRSSIGHLRQGRVTISALGGEQEDNHTPFFIRGTEWQCIESSLTIQKGGHNGMRPEVYLDSLDTIDYYFDDATFTRNGETICPVAEAYHYHVNPIGFQCSTVEDSSALELALHRVEHVSHMTAKVRKCNESPFVKNGELKIMTNGQVVAQTSYPAGEGIIELTHIDPYGDYQIDGRNTYVAEVYPANDPDVPKFTGSVDAWVEFYLSGQADLQVDHLEVQREDTGATLSPGDSVPDGTSVTVNAHIQNCGPVDAEDFYLKYYDNENYLDEAYQDSVVSGGCADVKMVSHTFPITGTGQHTLRVNLDTKNDISESNESNNSATFLINVSSPSTGTISIPLVSDWNLVSIPLHPDNTAIADLLSSIEGNYELVYAFDCSTKSWKIYDPSNPPFANTLSKIDEKMGLWIKMTAGDTLVIHGSEPNSSTIPLCTEWSLIGYPSRQNREVSEALNPIAGAYTLVYAYDAANASWKKFDPNDPPFANSLEQMQPGWGYWIKANQNTNWTIAN